LAGEGVDTIFGYSGGAILPTYDSNFRFNEDCEKSGQRPIQLIVPASEQGAGFMAAGYARSTGKVGVFLVTSGPGATNCVTPIRDCMADSVPVVLITGQVPRTALGSDAFQEAPVFSLMSRDTWFAVGRPNRDDTFSAAMQTQVIVRGTVDNRDDGDTGWDVELAIPLVAARGKDAGMKIDVPPKLGDTWRLNVVRADKDRSGKVRAASWNRIGCEDFHALDRMLTVQFADADGSITPAPSRPSQAKLYVPAARRLRGWMTRTWAPPAVKTRTLTLARRVSTYWPVTRVGSGAKFCAKGEPEMLKLLIVPFAAVPAFAAGAS
jgi:hypothetical protein